jgi:CHAT domain-containing protein
MKSAEVIQFSTHYVVDEKSPLLSKLLLAREPQLAETQSEDGFLDASEIYDMRLARTRLVVLSACQTGIERSYQGEGAISIARPFLKAGVPLVIASLWPVDSDSTSELMVSFHKHRKQDEALSTAEALRRAEREMLAGATVRYRHPYYWAAFATIGGYARF